MELRPMQLFWFAVLFYCTIAKDDPKQVIIYTNYKQENYYPAEPTEIREITLEEKKNNDDKLLKNFEFRRKQGVPNVLEMVHHRTTVSIEITDNHEHDVRTMFEEKVWRLNEIDLHEATKDFNDEAKKHYTGNWNNYWGLRSNLRKTLQNALNDAQSNHLKWTNIPLTHCEKENFIGTGFDDISLGLKIGGNKILRCDQPFSGELVTITCQDDGTWEIERPVCTQNTQESQKVHLTTTLYYKDASTNEEKKEIEIGKVNTSYFTFYQKSSSTNTQYLPGLNSNELILKLKEYDLEIPLKNGETQFLKDIEKKMYENMSDKELLKYISNYSLFRTHFNDYEKKRKRLRIDGNREKVIKEILDNDLNKNFPTKILSKWTNINSPNVDYHPQPYYEPASEENETLPVYAIVLIVVGGVLVFAGIGLAVYCLKCRKKNQSEEQFILEGEEDQSKIKVTASGIKEEIEV